MKKLILLFIIILMVNYTYSQDESVQEQAVKGSIAIELNTALGRNEVTLYNIGFDGGYFIMDDLALKIGLGYGGYKIDYDVWADGGDSAGTFTYRLGAKYYVADTFPLQVDFTGAFESPLLLSFQGGYAFFLGENVSIEPGLRYGFSLNENFYAEGIFQLNVGFSVFF